MKKIVISICSVVLTSSFISSVSASAETFSQPKDMLDAQASVNVTVSGTGGAEIVITKNTLEGSGAEALEYYDKKVQNGSYTFLLDGCEYDISTKSYTSSYTIKIRSIADNKSEYVAENIVIPDSGYETSVRFTTYNYSVDLSESSERDISSQVSETDTNGEKKTDAVISIKYKKYSLGDVNNDSAIDSKDAVEILQDYASFIINGKYSLDMDSADVNQDGSIDSKDAVNVLIYFASSIINKDIVSIEEFFK